MLPKAQAAVMRILNGQGATKHGDSWKTRDDRVDMSHAKVHEVRYFDEDWPDRDAESGELHLTHAIARMMLVLERRLIKDAEAQTKMG